MPPKKLRSTATERAGIHYVSGVVERANCIFQEIERRNDFGNDAIVELVEGEDVRGICVAAQIKSGKSYNMPADCIIPADRDHFEYWSKHSLPVIGIVHDPNENRAYWTSITGILKSDPTRARNGPFTIRFTKSELNRFDDDGFTTFFLPRFLRKPVLLSWDRAIQFVEAGTAEMRNIGLRALLDGHRNRVETWDVLIAAFKSSEPDDLDPFLVNALALIPGHGDILWHPGNTIDEGLRKRLRERLTQFGRAEIAKLLSRVGGNGFHRGSVGQSVDAIVSMVPATSRILASITNDELEDSDVRANALVLWANYSPEDAADSLQRLADAGGDLSELAVGLREQLSTYGFVYLY
ncbi:MAG: DUF4365 domain-containing protein [Gemmatimonadota bacterium]